ncbi:helix-turn-helix domain-containing protein [Halobacteria archaeon AArc-curdl1]|uniref:Helix-turn-helix domain-containing protein n=1 Tax=Natronosalvus hydrolyticus TaxID=2979988 RepID=A0AAP2ZCR3_9EURY|nr:helix-turn-helix domain-containing protein [Halobacteria archaeon AArc-curdl1]
MSNTLHHQQPCDPDKEHSDCDLEEMLTLLAEETPRAFYLHVESPTTVAELAEKFDVPLTTAYRTVDRLDDAGLLQPYENTSPQEYVRQRNQIQVTYDDTAMVTWLESGLFRTCEVTV